MVVSQAVITEVDHLNACILTQTIDHFFPTLNLSFLVAAIVQWLGLSGHVPHNEGRGFRLDVLD